MTQWKPIETLELKEVSRSRSEISDPVLLWVASPCYTGPIVGEFARIKAYNGDSYLHVYGCGFGGHEWEWDFSEKNITHWMELPEPPND